MAAIDALRGTFFEECEDLLAQMGEELARMSVAGDRPDIEAVHSVFRAVHSIKGGAGAFGLASLVSFAHMFETVLDQMRSGQLAPCAPLMHTLMRSYDVLSDLVAVARDGGPEPAQMATLFVELETVAEGGSDDVHEDAEDDFGFQPLMLDLSLPLGIDEDIIPVSAGFAIMFAPTSGLYAAGHEPAALLRSLEKLGEARLVADVDAVPLLSALDLSHPALCWRMDLSTDQPKDEIEEVFDFVGDLAVVTVTACDEICMAVSQVDPEATQILEEKPVLEPERSATTIPVPKSSAAPPAESQPARAAAEAATALPVAATIRVNLDRVDRLLNQIGELVIMEAILSQAISTAGLGDDGDIANSLEGIKQLAGNIQESVMSIRAQPLKPVFQRMQRVTREAADATGKQIRLRMIGDATEVDKTVIERLVDPLTHMIRNSVDHGIESIERRLAAGKPAEGTVTLSAAHRSGRVIIEIADDGAGINRARVREIAEARGLVSSEAQLAPSDIDNLLFVPGFSSKEEVSALSGRGVGLDVVRREIQALGGRVTINSVPGEGTTFTIALPLTLAVLEGMLIGVGTETMVLPISSIIETMRPNKDQMHILGSSGRLIASRGVLIPIIDLAECFGFTPIENIEHNVLIIVEYDSDRCVALAADRIYDQRQVVIKSLEDNYGNVPGISAATILGDGRIALIIDPEEIVQRAAADTLNRPLIVNG